MARFSPEDKEAHRLLGVMIMEYCDMMEHFAFFTADIGKKSRKNMEKGFEEARKLAKKLMNNKADIFKDEDEWNHVG